MVALAKSGTGWIQIIEANLVGWTGSSTVSLPAMQRARQMTLDFCAKLSINPYTHKRLGQWLEQAGAVGVEVREFEWKVGSETEFGRKGLKNLLDFLGMQKVVTADWEHFGHSGEECDRVIQQLEQHFGTRQEEVAWTFTAAWGRRPAS
jgi:hypothetical protein